MRTIDFRGKAVGSGRWIHGDLVWMGRQPAIFEYADYDNGCVTIQEKTLGMNTGLRDKNNHEIYGGDILAHNGRVIGHVVDGVRGYCFDVVYADPVSTAHGRYTESLSTIMKAMLRLLETSTTIPKW